MERHTTYLPKVRDQRKQQLRCALTTEKSEGTGLRTRYIHTESNRTKRQATRGRLRGYSRSCRSACIGTRSPGSAHRAPPRRQPDPPTPPRNGGPPQRALHRRSSPLTPWGNNCRLEHSWRRQAMRKVSRDRCALIWLRGSWESASSPCRFGGFASRREEGEGREAKRRGTAENWGE